MFHSPIIRMTTGAINRIDDRVVGMPIAPQGPGLSKFVGQLGQGVWLDDANILFDSTIGAVYGGHFRYVRLAAAAVTPVVRGQLVFWDLSVADNLFQVTTSEAVSATHAAVFRAGIVLNPSWTAGRYSVIQDVGPVAVRFRAALTTPGYIGASVYAAAVGGADLGYADVIDAAAPASFTDVTLLQKRYLGEAIEAPLNGGTQLVYVNFKNIRG